MNRYLKSTMMVIAGFCWISFAVLIGLFLFHYVVGGAGLQVFGFFFDVSSTTVLVGLIHLTGFLAAAWLCFVIGVGLCAYGLVPAPQPEKKKAVRQPRLCFAFPRRLTAKAPSREQSEALRCVRCRLTFATAVHICPDCGWTQPRWHHA